MAAELKRMRLACGFDVSEVADILGMGRASIYKIENATTIPHQPTLVMLCQVYGAGESVTAHLIELRKKGKEVGHWEAHQAGMDPEWALYTAALRDAKVLQVWEPELVPGLLQLVPDYLERLQDVQDVEPEQAAAVRAYRANQQEEFFRHRARRRVEILLGAGALRNLDPDPALQSAQIQHILALRETHGIDVRVTGGLHACMYGGFHILTPGLSGLGGSPFVYVESLDGARYIEHAHVVSRYESAHAEAFRLATPIEEWK
ncbi:helix-turn-helix domain-containing protein [Actinorhabdospora filicis]|uniref:helix-turn-helix domain-containing protein n=1 Tax=Actinorhabdospora filicis TaxID=1785913 RepID=UPI002553920D|nr:helix-turn-helix transcriptional regulator [Actinorhabdospora filicis]